MTNEERIKADAEGATNDHAKTLRTYDMEYPRMIARLFGYKEGYIAGATAENERAQEELKRANDAAIMFCNRYNVIVEQLAETVDRAQVLVDALEWIKAYGPGDELTVAFIDKHLEQWKSGKEVGVGDE